jgi:thymidylate synthase
VTYPETFDPVSISAKNHEEIDKFYPVPRRELSMYWNQRSVDTFLGLPFNIASYAFLLHMFSQQVDMIPGELTGFLGDTHLYENHLEFVEKQLERDPFAKPLPTLKLNKAKDIFSYTYEDFEIVGYDPFPNWKNVPIAV